MTRPAAVALNIREYTITPDMNLEPGKRYFASGKAAREPMSTVPEVPKTVMKKVLKI